MQRTKLGAYMTRSQNTRRDDPARFIRKVILPVALVAATAFAHGQAHAQIARDLTINPKPDLNLDLSQSLTKLKQECGNDSLLSYGDIRTFDVETTRTVRLAPQLCAALTPVSYAISPALPEATGLAINPETGVISGGISGKTGVHRPLKLSGLLLKNRNLAQPKLGQKFKNIRKLGRYTVTLQAKSRITGETFAVTAPFDYRVTDSNPIEVSIGYSTVTWHPYMGTAEHGRPEMAGGAPPYRYRVLNSAKLPRGFRFDRATGAISGAPLSGPNADGLQRSSIEVRDNRGRSKLLTVRIGAANQQQAIGPRDQCFIFVHGHRDDAGIPDPNQHARIYWGQTAEKDKIVKGVNLGKKAIPDPDDVTASRLPATHLDQSRDLVDIITNNRTQSGTLRASGTPMIAGNIRHRWAVVSYNSNQAYWLAANEVAEQLDAITHGRPDVLGNICDPSTVHGYVVVAHSMGGLTTSFVNGNSKSGAPSFRALYARAMERVNVVVTIQSPLNGSLGADIICGDMEHQWNAFDDILRVLPGFKCDEGVRSMRTRSDLRLENRIADGPLPVPTLMAGGHVGLSVLPSSLDIQSNGEIFPHFQFTRDVLENDGFVETLSQWACKREMYADFNNNPDKGRHYYGPCRGDQTIRRGFQPFVMSTETHDRGRNGYTRGAIVNPCAFLTFDQPVPTSARWSTGSCRNNSLAEATPPVGTNKFGLDLNIAEAVRCFVGFGKSDRNTRYTCPVSGQDILERNTALVANNS